MTNTIRVLHITSFFAPHTGGSQRYMEELYAHLIKLYPEVTVDVLCYNTDQAPAKERLRGINIYRIPCWQVIRGRFNLPYPWALWQMLGRLSKNHYDVVQTHLRFFDTSWWAWWWARKIGAISIFTEQVATTPVHQSWVVRTITKMVDATIARWCLPKYNILLATNQAARDFLTRSLAINKEISIVYGGIDTKFFRPTRSSYRTLPNNQLTLSANVLVVTFLGRLIWTKGVTVFYEAVKRFLPTAPNALVVFAGDGELKNWLVKQIAKDSLTDRVVLIGNLDRPETRKLLEATDIVVHPSHHNEGFPNVILEAGASGCLVIATDNAGTGEIISDRKNGLLIPSRNPEAIVKTLNWAMAHRRLAAGMGKALRKTVRQYDWDIIAKEYYRYLHRRQANSCLPFRNQ